MKTTKRQLRRIIRELHPRAAADDAYVAELERKEEELATQIRHASKDIHGYKDHYDLRGKSVEELEDILYDLANSQEQLAIDAMDRDEMEDRMGRDQELSRAEIAPRRQGMRRRPAGSKSQRRMEGKIRITKQKLRRIIFEELKKAEEQLDADTPEEVEPIEDAWSGGDNLTDRIDFEDLVSESPIPLKSRLDPYVASIMEAPYGPAGSEAYNSSYARDKKREEMNSRNANVIQLLQTVHVNIRELILDGVSEDVFEGLEEQLVLIEDAIHSLGGVLP